MAKKLAVNAANCIGCLRCEDVCSNAFFKVSNHDRSSIWIAVNESKENAINVCDQCGECIEMCPVGAIFRDSSGVVRIKRDECVGCLSCVGFCSAGAMRCYPGDPLPFKCVACGLCAKECPTEAISIVED